MGDDKNRQSLVRLLYRLRCCVAYDSRALNFKPSKCMSKTHFPRQPARTATNRGGTRLLGNQPPTIVSLPTADMPAATVKGTRHQPGLSFSTRNKYIVSKAQQHKTTTREHRTKMRGHKTHAAIFHSVLSEGVVNRASRSWPNSPTLTTTRTRLPGLKFFSFRAVGILPLTSCEGRSFDLQ